LRAFCIPWCLCSRRAAFLRIGQETLPARLLFWRLQSWRVCPFLKFLGVIGLPDCFQYCVSLGPVWKRANLFANVSCEFRKTILERLRLFETMPILHSEFLSVTRAFSNEVGTGSREENASINQKRKAPDV